MIETGCRPPLRRDPVVNSQVNFPSYRYSSPEIKVQQPKQFQIKYAAMAPPKRKTSYSGPNIHK